MLSEISSVNSSSCLSHIYSDDFFGHINIFTTLYGYVWGSKTIIRKIKIQVTNWKKIFKYCISDKEFIHKVFKNSKPSNNET